MSESPLSAEFWDSRYRRERTPWDAGRPPAALARYLAEHPGSGRRVLIPGCGTGVEIEAFASAGYHVTALDLSETAVARAKARLGPGLAARVEVGDFFRFFSAEGPFDVLYERAFLCALPPETWPEIGRRSFGLLKPGGLLVGSYFFALSDDGPPYGLTSEQDHAVFGFGFTTLSDTEIPAAESLPVFAGRERWIERRRAWST